MAYNQNRDYRRWQHSDLVTFQVRSEQSDLQISAERPLIDEAERALLDVLEQLEGYLERDPRFAKSLLPHSPLPDAPPIAQEMAQAAAVCGVGPMAAVAGAVAEHVGRELLRWSKQVIVENGGDIFLQTTTPRVAAIFAGESSLTGRVGLRLTRLDEPLGLCTSSGTVGPSLSFGRADAAIILARSAALADAAASALGNRLQTPDDMERALAFTKYLDGVWGAAAVMGDNLGAWGDLEIVRVETE
jgi:ApbE superfamily uncharacterized protein (UPF0280 family)